MTPLGSPEVPDVEAFGIAVPEKTFPVFPSLLKAHVRRPEKTVLPGVQDSAKQRKVVGFQLFPNIRIGNQKNAVRVAEQLRGSFSGEVGKDGHHDGLVGVDGQEGDGPAGRIAGAQGNLVTLPDAGSLKEDMILFDAGSQFGIGVAGSAIVAQGGFALSEPDLLFQFF